MDKKYVFNFLMKAGLYDFAVKKIDIISASLKKCGDKINVDGHNTIFIDKTGKLKLINNINQYE